MTWYLGGELIRCAACGRLVLDDDPHDVFDDDSFDLRIFHSSCCPICGGTQRQEPFTMSESHECGWYRARAVSWVDGGGYVVDYHRVTGTGPDLIRRLVDAQDTVELGTTAVLELTPAPLPRDVAPNPEPDPTPPIVDQAIPQREDTW